MSKQKSSDPSGKRQVSTERVIPGAAAAIFDLLADPSRHGEIDGSGSVKQPTTPSQRLELGSKFGMAMKIGVPYRVSNTVVEFEENRRIAWCHFNGHRWRYQLEPVTEPGGGQATKVRETFDWSTARLPFVFDVLSVPRRNLASMEKTLEKLEGVMTSRGASGA